MRGEFIAAHLFHPVVGKQHLVEVSVRLVDVWPGTFFLGVLFEPPTPVDVPEEAIAVDGLVSIITEDGKDLVGVE